MNKLNVLRLCVALVALFATSYSIVSSDFSIFQALSKFTYISNISVIVVLFLVFLGKLEDKTIILVLPQILLTFVVFSLVLSDGIATEPFYSVIEHYCVPIYLFFDYLCFVKNSERVNKVFLVLLLYTLIYSFYIFTYGYLSGYYPYFFVDLNKYSLMSVAINIVVIIALVFGIYISLELLRKARYQLVKK